MGKRDSNDNAKVQAVADALELADVIWKASSSAQDLPNVIWRGAKSGKRYPGAAKRHLEGAQNTAQRKPHQ